MEQRTTSSSSAALAKGTVELSTTSSSREASAMRRLLFYPEIVTRVIELSDTADIAALQKIPEFNVYIKKYQTSIIKEKNTFFLLPAGWAGTQAIITHDPRYPVNAPIEPLVTYCRNTAVRFIDTWAAIGIMKGRNAEINSLLFHSSYLRMCPDMVLGTEITWPKLDDKAVPKLREMLRRALSICDATSDIEARIVIAQNIPLPQYGYFPSGAYPLTQEDAQLGPLLDHQANILCTYTIPMQTRERQSTFVQSLCDADLLALWTLCYLASESFHERRSTAFRDDMNLAVKMERAFKHCILSYGSYFMYGHAHSFGAREMHVRDLSDSVIDELMVDDTVLPPGALDALNSTVMRRFKVKMVELDTTMLSMLVEVLGVDKEAFDNPPASCDR